MTFTPDDRSMWQHSSPLIRVQFSSISSLTGQATYELMPRHAKKQAFSAATGAIEVTSAGVDVPRQFQPCNNELNTTTLLSWRSIAGTGLKSLSIIFKLAKSFLELLLSFRAMLVQHKLVTELPR